jgi:predicted RNA-binding protein YlqC (UPF0109 family)
MQGLIDYMVRSIAQHPDGISIAAHEGDASLFLELDVHPEDRDLLQADDGALLEAMKQILTAAGGKRKAVLELVGVAADATEE